MRLSAKYQNGAKMRHRINLACQKIAAVGQFCANWFVVRRQAAHCIGNADIMQGDIIIGIGAVGAARQPEAGQHSEQIAPGGITGKWPTRAIGTA